MGRRHYVAIPLLLIPGLVLGFYEYRFRQDLSQFSEVASQVAGRPVQMECQRLTGALVDVTGELGYVEFDAAGVPADVGRLERDACNDLRSYLRGDKQQPTIEQVIAVAVLSHESQHLAGERDEARTECASIQGLADVARQLGATSQQAAALAERYAVEIYPRMPSAYRSADCVMDGEWDRTPGDGAWP